MFGSVPLQPPRGLVPGRFAEPVEMEEQFVDAHIADCERATRGGVAEVEEARQPAGFPERLAGAAGDLMLAALHRRALLTGRHLGIGMHFRKLR